MLRFDEATYLSPLFKFILSERLRKGMRGSNLLLFPKFINVGSVLFCNFIEFIVLLYISLITSISRYKQYMI